MIEYLGDDLLRVVKHDGFWRVNLHSTEKDFKNKELILALWEAVKYKLVKKK